MECLQVIFGFSKFTRSVNVAHRCKSFVVISQTSCLKLAQSLLIEGRLWFATERTSKDNLLAGILLLVLLVYGCFVLRVARQANGIATARHIILYKYCICTCTGKGHQADGAVLGRRQWSEEVGILELLPELLGQYIKPLTDILRGQLLGLTGLRLLTLLSHGDIYRNFLYALAHNGGRTRVVDFVALRLFELTCNLHAESAKFSIESKNLLRLAPFQV